MTTTRPAAKNTTTVNDGRPKPITWDLLVELEPKLGALYNEAKSYRRGPHYCATSTWYGWRTGSRGSFKSKVCALIGFERGVLEDDSDDTRCGPIDLADVVLTEYERPVDDDPRLYTPWAYDLAYQTICKALPNCRNSRCGCR